MTRKEFIDEIMEPMWRHNFRPREEARRHQTINDYYNALQHYGIDRLRVAAIKVIQTWTGKYGIPKIAEFVTYIPPAFKPPPLPEPARTGGLPPGYMRYLLAIQPNGAPLATIARARLQREGDTREIPKLTGSYMEKLVQAVVLAKEEKAHPRTIKTLERAERALYG